MSLPDTPDNKAPITFIRFLQDGQERTGKGRDAWALAELVKAGAEGCTPITHPGPRWSSYTHKWRKRGLSIETITEMHGGPFAGKHARYVLRTPIVVLETGAAND